MIFYPIAIVNNLIHIARGFDKGLTHLKIQKLLYILYARYLILTDKALFANRFEAWTYGPVIAEVYFALKDYGNCTIFDSIESADGRLYKATVTNELGQCLMGTWGKFGNCAARELVTLTHDSMGWKRAMEKRRNGNEDYIDDKDIGKDGLKWFEVKFFQLL